MQLPRVGLCRSSVIFIVPLSTRGLAWVAGAITGFEPAVELCKFHDLFHDLSKFSKALGLAVSLQKF